MATCHFHLNPMNQLLGVMSHHGVIAEDSLRLRSEELLGERLPVERPECRIGPAIVFLAGVKHTAARQIIGEIVPQLLAPVPSPLHAAGEELRQRLGMLLQEQVEVEEHV